MVSNWCAGAALLLLGGCVTVPMAAYAPATTAEISGALQVQPFSYSPRQAVPADVVANTGMGSVHLSEPVARYFTKAVARELRQAGVSLKGQCDLGGDVLNLSIDDAGFGAVTYLSQVRYWLALDGSALLDKTFDHEFSTGKQLEPSALAAYLGQAVAGNIGQLLDDPEFVNALADHCREAT